MGNVSTLFICIAVDICLNLQILPWFVFSFIYSVQIILNHGKLSPVWRSAMFSKRTRESGSLFDLANWNNGGKYDLQDESSQLLRRSNSSLLTWCFFHSSLSLSLSGRAASLSVPCSVTVQYRKHVIVDIFSACQCHICIINLSCLHICYSIFSIVFLLTIPNERGGYMNENLWVIMA